MSAEDQQHFSSLVHLLPKTGKWRWVALLIAIPSIIGAVIALVVWDVAAVSYFKGVTFASQVAPAHDSAIRAMDKQIGIVTVAERETRDSLRAEGWLFAPLVTR